jgi:hypothetical protein
VRHGVFDFYVQMGRKYKLISLPVDVVENYSNFRIEYLKKFNTPAPILSNNEWLAVLIKICESKRIEG